MARVKQSFCIPMYLNGNSSTDYRVVIEAAAKIGFPAFEIWGREGTPFEDLVRYAKDNGMVIASMCGHGTLTDGLNRPENHARIREELKRSIAVAAEVGISNLICFTGNRYELSDADCIPITVEGLQPVLADAEAAGINLNIELLNSKVDHAGYQCDHSAYGVAICRQLGSPRAKLLYDIYHMQIMEGDLCRTITDSIAHIGHFHTAGNPGRHDLDATQEINYPPVIASIINAGYDGYVAHEFMPKGDKIAALEAAFMLCNIDIMVA